MQRGLDDMAAAVGALAAATAAAHDAPAVLAGVAEALEPVVPVGAAALWLGSGPDEHVVVYPAGATPPTSQERGCLTAAVRGTGWQPGHLVIRPAAGAAFDDGSQALLDVAATQVAGALERARLYKEVFELERLKTDFIARVSHELRTPITIITGFIDTLLAHDGRLDDDQRRHMLDRSQSAAARLSRLIEELLVLSRMEAGVVTPDPEPVDLAALFDEARASAGEPDQVIVVPPQVGPVTTDPALLARVLGLLVDNALKYGGTAEVSAAAATPEDRSQGARHRIEVRDRGPGFDADTRATAFEMFTRGPNTNAVPGLGAGLAIARTIVEVLDGTLEIADPPDGPGAVLRILLR